MDNKPSSKGLGLDNEFIIWYLFGSNDVKPVTSSDQHYSDIYQQKAIPSDRLSDDFSIFHSYACQSFQPEFQLCWSSIPGNEFGVMASRLIPQGVWIGPYEGKLIDINKVDKCEDRTNMWEILQQNQLRYFIEGADLSSTNWMKFIQCARNKSEQNTSAFQYKGRVYYRALRDIDIGEEILVWYDDCYVQYMGIPIMGQANVKRNGITNSSEEYSHCHHKKHCTKSNNSKCVDPPLLFGKTLCEERVDFNSNSDEQEKSLMVSQTAFLGVNSFGCNRVKSPGGTSNFHSNTSVRNCITLKEKTVERFQCTQCCNKFSQRALLQMHLCPGQTNAPYHCGQCTSTFSNSSDLRSHVVHHLGKKPFKCGFCERSFVCITTLNNHIRMHTGGK